MVAVPTGDQIPQTTPPADTAREQARKRLDDRRGLWTHFFVYVVTNAFIVAVWMLTGQGYFWPAWVIAGWAMALLFHGWDYYWSWRRPITDADIDAELRREKG